jgi:polyisoprenoid-binding protein YceI
MRNTFKTLTATAAITLVAALAGAGARVRYQAAPTNEMKISGTSTIHDWHAVSSRIDGAIELDPTSLDTAKFDALPTVKVVVKADTLKSGKSGMDSVMYKALKSDKFPTITYEMTAATPHGTPANGTAMFMTKGKLTVAGVTREVSMHTTVKKTADGLEITGETPLKMTDFKISPPTAMLGTIKSGDDIKVSFRWVVKKS